MTDQLANPKISGIKGAIKNKYGDELLKIIGSAIINFNASAIGCNNPQNPTTSGPRRR